MGIISKLKGLAGRVFGKKQAVPSERAQAKAASFALPYSGKRTNNTTAKRRLHSDANREYRHVSVEVTREHVLFSQLIKGWWFFNKPAGTTYNVGINATKRAINTLPKRERRAARTAFIQQLRKDGIK